MDIAKISGIRPGDWEVVDRAFASVEAQPIACCNWAETYPYAPDVQFRMFHTGDYLMLRFDVAERYTAARVAEDNGRVWTDSCVEFFIAPDTESYYNFETSCIGRLLLGYHRQGEKTVSAPAEALGSVIRHIAARHAVRGARRRQPLVGRAGHSSAGAVPPRPDRLERRGGARQPLQVRRRPFAPPLPLVAPHTDGKTEFPPSGIFRSYQIQII